MRSLGPKVTRYLFYAVLVAGGVFLCATLALSTFTSTSQATGLNTPWLLGLCCIVPIGLAGWALANESR